MLVGTAADRSITTQGASNLFRTRPPGDYTGAAAGTFVGKRGHVYRMGDAIAMEPQVFPDTPNQPAFGTARVEPGKPYHHRMIFRVSAR